MSTWDEWAWLGDHLAIDFANTVRWVDGQQIELLACPDDLKRWLDLEPAALPRPAEVANELLDRLRELRAASIEVLAAAEQGRTPPEAATAMINDVIRRVRPVNLLALAGEYRAEVAADVDPAEQLLAVLADGVVDLLRRDGLANLARCSAPGCGQFYHRARPNQRWCSPGCGNRARVDRHRHRRRVSS